MAFYGGEGGAGFDGAYNGEVLEGEVAVRGVVAWCEGVFGGGGC